jgi:hypothetical protein
MRNLAGDRECDTVIAGELALTGIELVHGKRSDYEVAASITGKLGKFVFTRAWSYWIVGGKVPLGVANKLYRLNKEKIRSGGDCACRSPETWAREGFIDTYHIDSQEGLNLFVKTIKEHGLDKE